MPPQRKIFISYRRQDNAEFVERIRDWFIMKYGRANVFMDFDTIPPMVKFADYIRHSIEACDAMLVIIGPKWLDILKERLQTSDEDFVRTEIGMGLKLGKPIAPILIFDAHMPKATDLPEDLRPLLDFNAGSLKAGRDFLDNIERILAAVEDQLAQQESSQQPSKPAPQAWQPDPAQWTPPPPTPGQVWPNPSMSMGAQEYFNRGFQRAAAGDHDGAIGDYSEAIRLHPLFADAYNNRGWSLFQKGNLDAAIQDYNIAIQQFGQNPGYYVNRAMAFDRKGQPNAAILDYSASLLINPQNATIYRWRGLAYAATGNLDAALADFNAAIWLNPMDVDSHQNRGNVFLEKHQYDAAIANYMDALR
ncbi:MAG TPA: tetratricopeptide repeat protein, partial [Phototrophicaceae bacterium]|nr:tetratricopeptide repeat protein [Phototrophicaceae bacterium]